MPTKITALLAACLLVASTVHAEDKKEPSPEEIQKAYEKFAKPGIHHKNLRRLVGRWKGEVTQYMGPKTSTSTGTAVFRSIMGGRYLVQNWRGSFEGKAFVGMSIAGYDNAKKKYVSSWIDSMGTGIMNSTGTYDVKKRTLTEIGVSSSPMGDMKFKMVSKYIDNDNFTLTMYMVSPEGEKKAMFIKYTRDKSKRKDRVKDK